MAHHLWWDSEMSRQEEKFTLKGGPPIARVGVTYRVVSLHLLFILKTKVCDFGVKCLQPFNK